MMAVTELLNLRLRSITWQNELISSYEFVSADGSPLPPFSAGAHVGLVLPVGERSYSLANPPSESFRYVLGIAREEAGQGGSRYVHDTLRVGNVIQIRPPRNHFPLHDGAGSAVLIAGGIGITPMLSMAADLQAHSRPWRLTYAVKSARHAAFEAELARWPGKVALHHDDVEQGFLNVRRLVETASAGAHFYCCGPSAMLNSFLEATRDLPADVVHYERFAAEVPVDVSGDQFEVKLARNNTTVKVNEGQSILDALTQAGVAVTSSCGQGICGVCETRVLAGVPDHRDGLLSEAERQSNKVMMICCSRSKTPSLTLDL